MRKLKIYLDTSVINFLFADDAPLYKDITIEFFENYINEYEVYISEIVLVEINGTKNEGKKNLLLGVIDKYNIKIYEKGNEQIVDLAKQYIDSKIIPENKLNDAMHIAFATYFEFDILLSWNFKHLANIKKQMQVNSLNELNGYSKTLLLVNPMEVLYEK